MPDCVALAFKLLFKCSIKYYDIKRISEAIPDYLLKAYSQGQQ